MGDHLVIVLLPLVRHIYPKWDTKMAVNLKYLMPLLFFMDNQHLLQSGVGENVCKCDDCTHENVSILAPDENDQRIALSKKGVEIFD